MFCNRKNGMKKAFLLLFFVTVMVLAISPLHLTNQYLRSSDFDVVVAAADESAAAIAARYTVDAEQAGSLCEAIIDVNGLAPDGALREGQSLRVPVLAREKGTEVASREVGAVHGK